MTEETTRIELTFGRIECPSCGERRIRSQPCPTCRTKPDPREVDPERLRLDRLARQALAVLDQPAVGDESPSELGVLLTLWEDLSSWVQEFLNGLRAAAASSTGEDDLLEALDRLKSIESRVARVPTLRPWIVVIEPLRKVMDECNQIARRYLEAFTARLPADAQRAAEEGQRAIDAVAVSAQSIGPLLGRWERLADSSSVQQTLTSLFEEAYEESGAEDLLGFDRRGHILYDRITGNDRCPPGNGLILQLAQIQVRTTGDESAFWDGVAKTFEALRRRPERLRNVLESDEWPADFLDAADRAYGASALFHAATTAARRTRDEIRALLTLALDLVEGPGKHFAGTLLATENGKPYEALRKRDAGALLQQCRDQHLTPFTDGLDPALRAARAHEEWRLEGDVIVLGGRRRLERRLTVDEVVDRVLACAESILGLETAVRCAAGTLGIDVPNPDLVADLELPYAEAIELALTMAGWTEIEVEMVDDVVRAAGRTRTTKEEVAKAIGPMLPSLPAGCETLELTARAGDAELCFAGPVESFRRWARADDEAERELYLVEAWHRWTFEGEPLYSPDYVRKFFATKAGQAIQLALPQATSALRQLIDAARRLGDGELEQCLLAYLRQLRWKELGLPSEPGIQHEAGKLISWMQKTVAQPFAGGAS